MKKEGRKTKQKELIKSELKKFNVFFTAEDLFNKVKEKNDILPK